MDEMREQQCPRTVGSYSRTFTHLERLLESGELLFVDAGVDDQEEDWWHGRDPGDGVLQGRELGDQLGGLDH